MSAPVLLVLGPNPAWQKTLFFDAFRPGQVNRAHRLEEFASGKGINFCRAAGCHGRAATCLVQFLGGRSGQSISEALEQEQLPAVSIPLAAATRCCTTCLDEPAQSMTELIEPAATAGEAAVEAFLAAVAERVSGADAMALCGTLPGETTPALYVRAAQLAAQAGKALLVDSWQQIEPVLATGGLIHLKINREELVSLAGDRQIPAAAGWMFEHFPLKSLAVTDGAASAWLTDGVLLHQFHLPRLPRIVNPLGSGDTAGAVFLSELVNHTPLAEAFAAGLAAASANCLSSRCGRFDPTDAQILRRQITIESTQLQEKIDHE